MVAYIQQLIKDLIERLRFHDWDKLQAVDQRFGALAEEVNRLDPRDFAPTSQFAFLEARLAVRHLSSTTESGWLIFDSSLRQAQGAMSANLTKIEQINAKPEGQWANPKNRQETIESLQRQAAYSDQEIKNCNQAFDYAIETLEMLHSILNDYGGPSGKAVARSFVFIADPDLRRIVERDYRELVLILLPGGCLEEQRH
jgi:hypothetical protein